MANIDKLNFTFIDGQTTISANHLNGFVDRINKLIDAVGDSPSPVTVATPVISINGTSATISCATAGATIYYTTNGNTPTSSSTQYTGAITLTQACTIKAIAVKDGVSSSVASQSYNPASPVVYKTYAATTGSDQYVDISSLTDLAALTFNNVKVEVEAILLQKVTKMGLWSMRNKYCGIATYSSGNKLFFAPNFSTSSETYVEPIVDHLYQITQNTKTGVCSVDGTDYNASAIESSGTSTNWGIFTLMTTNEPSTEYFSNGNWKLKSFKVYNATTNALVADIVPATYNGTPCLYDKVTDTPLYPNSGTLAVE